MSSALIFATNNPNKVHEIRLAVGSRFQILTLIDAGISVEIPEPYDSLKENASEKSRVILHLSQKNCFSEDTGLEVDCLNGAPGVKSARFAGEKANSQENIELLLNRMKAASNRSARFRTVISLRMNGDEYFFEGVCEGKIAEAQRGTNGFGYDAVFIPDGAQQTFAEMSLSEKNVFSHRKKAVEQLIDFLNKGAWKE